jgi:hypothetical protein
MLLALALPALSVAAEKAPPKPYDKTIPVSEGEDAPPEKLANIKLVYGGRIKLDAMYTHVSDADIPSPSLPRDHYQASGIPVAAGGTDEAHTFFDYNAKGTMLWFKGDADYGSHEIGTHVEIDFRVNPGAGNEVVTNAYNPGLRHAYLTYDNWLFGQTFSLFRNITAAPETIDSAGGPGESLVLVRQPQVRYTLGGWQVSLENNETSLTANGGSSTRNVTGDARLPDLVVRYDFAPGFGQFASALLLRQLAADNAALAPVSADGTATGLGVMLSGRIPAFGEDDVRFNVMAGEGIGRYATAATIDDAVVRADGSLDPIPLVAGYVVYRHVWTPRWRSNALLSGMLADNDTEQTGLGVTRSVSGVHINTLYSPVEKMTFGMQLIHAIREIEQPEAGGDSGEHGELTRLQFTVMYIF